MSDPAKAGGGPLYDVACHRIDLMNYLFGHPTRVAGQLSTLVQPIPVEDNASMLIEYDSGVRGMVDVRWHSRVARDEFRIRGTEGEIEMTPLNGPDLSYPGGSEQLTALANLHLSLHRGFLSVPCGKATRRAPAGATALETDWVIDRAKR